jgi:hypothetical protein
VTPSKCTKSELKKVGVTYTTTELIEGGMIERAISRLTCDQCGKAWGLPIVMSGKSWPSDWWICPNGCNKPQASQVAVGEQADIQRRWQANVRKWVAKKSKRRTSTR